MLKVRLHTSPQTHATSFSNILSESKEDARAETEELETIRIYVHFGGKGKAIEENM